MTLLRPILISFALPLFAASGVAWGQSLDGTGRAQAMMMNDGKSNIHRDGHYVAYHSLTDADASTVSQRFDNVHSALAQMVAEMTSALAPDRELIEQYLSEQEAVINAELPRTRRARDLAIQASENALFAQQKTQEERQRAERYLARTVEARRQAENLEHITRSSLTEAEHLQANAYEALVYARQQRDIANQRRQAAVGSANQSGDFADAAVGAYDDVKQERSRIENLLRQADTAASEANAARAAAQAAEASALAARQDVASSARGLNTHRSRASQAAASAASAATTSATIMSNAQSVLITGANNLNGTLGGYNTRMNALVSRLDELGM